MTRVWRRGNAVGVVDSGYRSVILRLDDETGCVPRVLEGSAAAVWRLIDGSRGEGAIIAKLSETYGSPRREIESDVRRFLDELSDAGFIQLRSSVGAP